jgi:hypothetical protein
MIPGRKVETFASTEMIRAQTFGRVSIVAAREAVQAGVSMMRNRCRRWLRVVWKTRFAKAVERLALSQVGKTEWKAQGWIYEVIK